MLAQGGRQQEDIRTFASRGVAFRPELASGLTGRDGSRKEMLETYQRRSRHIALQSPGEHDRAEDEGHQSQEECQPCTIWDSWGTCPESQCWHPDPNVVSVRQQTPSSSSVIFTEMGQLAPSSSSVIFTKMGQRGSIIFVL